MMLWSSENGSYLLSICVSNLTDAVDAAMRRFADSAVVVVEVLEKRPILWVKWLDLGKGVTKTVACGDQARQGRVST